MSIYGLRTEHALEGTLKFYAWKDRMEVVLDDNELLEYIKTNIPKPPTSNAQPLTQWRKDIAKARRMILEELETILFQICMGGKICCRCGRPLVICLKAVMMLEKLL